MISDRLKDIIFKKLYKDLSHVEIIHFHDYIWFIDREEKFWYFRYCKSDGRLLWRYGFFTKFFVLFTMDDYEFTPVISSWVEEVLNYKVDTTMSHNRELFSGVEEVLNYKVNTTGDYLWESAIAVEKVLNYKVDTTGHSENPVEYLVEESLNCKVNETYKLETMLVRKVDEVLNHNVTE